MYAKYILAVYCIKKGSLNKMDVQETVLGTVTELNSGAAVLHNIFKSRLIKQSKVYLLTQDLPIFCQ